MPKYAAINGGDPLLTWIGQALTMTGVTAAFIAIVRRYFGEPNSIASGGTGATNGTATANAPMATGPSNSMVGVLGGATRIDQAAPILLSFMLFSTWYQTAAIKKGLTSGARLTATGSYKLNHEKAMALSAPYLHQEPADIQAAVVRIDKCLIELLAGFPVTKGELENGISPPGSEKAVERAALLMHFRDDILLSRPFKRIEVEAWKTSAGRQELRARLDDRLKDYPPEHRSFCRQVLLTIAARSVNLDTEPAESMDHAQSAAPRQSRSPMSKRNRKFVVDLRGLPGTGKDHLFRMVEEELKIPVVNVLVPPDEMEGPAALLGRPWDAILAADHPTNDHALLGLIVAAFFKARCTNVFINMPEMDWTHKGVRNMMKIISDPAEQKIHLAGLDVDIFVGDMNLGMSSNDMDIEPANRDRAHQFGVFTKVSQGARESASRQRFDDAVENYHDSIALGGDIPADDIAKRKKQALYLFEAILPNLLDTAKGDPANSASQPSSARMLMVEGLAIYICNEIDAGKPPSESDLVLYVTDYFQGRTPGQSITDSETAVPAGSGA